MAMDSAALISAAEAGSRVWAAASEAIALLPDAVSGAFAWAGSAADWAAIGACAAALLAAALAVSIATGRWLGPEGGVGRWLLGSLLFVASGFVLHLLLPVTDRIRAISFALFVCVAFVLICTAFTRLVLRRGTGHADAVLVRLAATAFALIATGYILLGLMRLSAQPIEARLGLGMAFWVALLLLVAGFVARFAGWTRRRRRDSPDAAPPPHDPISHLLTRRTEWFFGTVLLLIAVLSMVSAVQDGPKAFFFGALALLLLGGLPALLTFLPLHALGEASEARPWRATLRRCGRLLVFIGFWLALAWLLGVDIFTVASDRLGEAAVRVLIDIGIAVSLGYLFWQVATAILDGLAGRALHPSADDPAGEAAHSASRIETFVPMLRTLTVALIVTSTGMIVLASAGVNIGPLLAGAGIFGIALGFGSQALVKDVISGLFFLADDAFRIGEYIEVGSAKGTVESISIRSMKLRHPRGAVFTVPFGQVGMVNNQSRDWAIVKIEFTVDFDTDLRKAKLIVRAIAEEIEADADLARGMLQPLKFQGVRRMEPYGLVVGVKFMTVPGEQFLLQREVYARIRDEFARSGIRFARPQVRVESGADGLTPETLAVAAANGLPKQEDPEQDKEKEKPG